MKELENIVEYDGKWHKKGKDGNCEDFTMNDLRELIEKTRQEKLKRVSEVRIDIIEKTGCSWSFPIHCPHWLLWILSKLEKRNY